MPLGHDCVYAASLIILKKALFCWPSHIKQNYCVPIMLKHMHTHAIHIYRQTHSLKCLYLCAQLLMCFMLNNARLNIFFRLLADQYGVFSG